MLDLTEVKQDYYIRKALSNYEELKNNYEKEIQQCKGKLYPKIDEVSWWDKFCKNESYSNSTAVYKYKSICEVLEAYEEVYVELSYLDNMSGDIKITPNQARFIDKFIHIAVEDF